MSKKKLVIALVLILGGVYGAWSYKAMQALELVQRNIMHLQEQMVAQGGWMSLRYDTLDVGGFPRAPVVSLVNPCVDYKQPVRRTMQVCAKKVKIAAQSYELNLFRLSLPVAAKAQEVIEGKTVEYVVAVDAAPEVLLRLPAAQADDQALPAAFKAFSKQKSTAQLAALPQDMFHQWAPRLPESLALRVATGGKTKQVDFHFPSVPLPVWYALRYDLSHPVDIFISLLAETMANGKDAQPIFVP